MRRVARKPRSPPRPLSPLHVLRRFLPSRPGRIAAASAVLVCVLIGGVYAARASEPSGIAAVLGASPGISPRLSVGAPFRRCVERVPAGGSIARAECPAPHTRRRPTTADAGIAPGADDPRSLHLLALLDIVADDPRGIALDRAITALRRAAELSDDPAPALVDLSAALIVRAERMQTPRDLLEAYEIAEQATSREPGNAAALYNRALALDRFGLVEETAEDWKRAIAADPSSAWAGEAHRRLRTLQSIHPPVPPRDDAPLADYLRYAAEEPQGARELGMDKLLADWGDATLRGDRAHADDRLRRAETLGAALLRRPGGDASLADMTRAIRRAAADSAATRRLAEAHREYGAAHTLFDNADYVGAEPRFTAAADSSVSSQPLREWARTYAGTTAVHNRRRQEGERALLGVIGEVDRDRHPAILARAQWSLANTVNRDDRWETGLRLAQESIQGFARAGEAENQAAVLSVSADARFVMGEADSGYVAIAHGLALICHHRSSVRLHNLLGAGADGIAADGLVRAAIRLQDEGVRVGARNSSKYAAEARLRRARLLLTVGDSARAHGDIRASRPLIASLSMGYAREWLGADLRETEALAELRPEDASRSFDEAATFFSGIRIPYRFLTQLVGAARSRLEAGDLRGAERRLETVFRILEQRRDSVVIEPRRAAVFDAARTAVDRLVMLKVARGNAVDALRFADRARASLSLPASATDRAMTVLQSPPGEVVVEYALVGDTLLAWTVDGQRVDLFRSVVDTLQLARTITELEDHLERGGSEREVAPHLARLSAWLIHPVEGRLGSRPLVIVADGLIAAVPFAALQGQAGRYLVEDHSLRFAVSLTAAHGGARAARGHSATFVADPAIDPGEHPLLDRLAHAREEVRSIARGYPGATVIEGADATRPSLTAALRRSALLHFAGHAVFDDARPERSYLVLAPTPGVPGSGRLTAAEIARLGPHLPRLVILSACQTVRGGHRRAAGYTGLSGALLAAGAGGTLASTWNVDDRLTSALMEEFHRQWRSSADPARALQKAQLALIHSNNSALRSPAAWGGFRYSGD